jgi:hypothetical protein
MILAVIDIMIQRRDNAASPKQDANFLISAPIDEAVIRNRPERLELEASGQR